jgi:penicillin-binding protein 1C
MMLPKNASYAKTCPYHQMVHLDQSEQYRVNSSCYSVHNMKSKSWFVIPPVPEWYYKKNNPFYRPLPPFLKGCEVNNQKEMAVIYPKNFSKILIPRELDGTKGKVVFEVVHRQSQKIIYWHLDQKYIGQSHNQHRMELDAQAGKHQMTLVDENGRSLSWKFEIM